MPLMTQDEERQATDPMRIMTIEEVAEVLRIAPAGVRARFVAGKIPGAFRDGKFWRIRRYKLDEYIQKQEESGGT